MVGVCGYCLSEFAFGIYVDYWHYEFQLQNNYLYLTVYHTSNLDGKKDSIGLKTR